MKLQATTIEFQHQAKEMMLHTINKLKEQNQNMTELLQDKENSKKQQTKNALF